MRPRCRPLAAALLLTLLAVLPAVAADPPADPRTLTFPPLVYEIPATERFALPNGLVVHLLSDRSLPWIRMTAYVAVGAAYEPAEKTGLASLAGSLLRDGGIAGKSPDAVDAELDFMAASIGSGIGDEAGILSLTALTPHFPATLGLFAGMLRTPAFDPDRFRQKVNETLEGLRRQDDNPRQVAARELRRAIYGSHPLGRHPTPATVAAVTRADLAAFHHRYVHPGRIVLAVAGDIDRAALEAALAAAFGDWRSEGGSLPVIAPPAATAGPVVLHGQRNLVQSVIRMGHLGITVDNPDLHALRVMDFILGAGSFTSRLMTRIRSDEGLAYSVWSGFDAGRRWPGLFTAGTETKSASTGRAIGLMREILTEMTRREVTAEELSLAKASIVNAFVFGFTDAERIVNQRARVEFYAYPEGYLERYRERIAAVTAAEVLRVARAYLHPDRLVTVVIGDAAGFDRPLTDFGEVRPLPAGP